MAALGVVANGRRPACIRALPRKAGRREPCRRLRSRDLPSSDERRVPSSGLRNGRGKGPATLDAEDLTAGRGAVQIIAGHGRTFGQSCCFVYPCACEVTAVADPSPPARPHTPSFSTSSSSSSGCMTPPRRARQLRTTSPRCAYLSWEGDYIYIYIYIYREREIYT